MMTLRRVKYLISVLFVLCSLSSNAQTTVPTITNSNTLAMGQYFDALCNALFKNLGTANPRVTIQAATQQGQTDLTNACGNYVNGQRSGQQIQTFIEGIDPTGFISFKLDSLLFAQSDNESSMDRMQALRRDHHANTAGITSDHHAEYAAVGGGASADDAKDLSGNKLGLWFRVNSSNGKKDPTLLTTSLNGNQYSGTVGLDYRITDNAVLGGLLGYRHAKTDFGDGGSAGNMDSKTTNISAYFSSYLYKDLYLDAVVNYSKVKFNTDRHVFDLSPTPVLHVSPGSTNGNTLSIGAALGYEFAVNAWTITPSLHYLHIDSKIDAFEESGAGPFDLSYGKQHYNSSSARLDLNIAYAISSDGAVWLPHLRTELIKEFGANIDTFDVRFINDPTSASPTPLPVQMDKLDDLYYRLSLGVAAQFHNNIAAYLDYQQLVGFDAVSLSNVVAGMRFQF